LEIVLAKNRGFCYGVERAVKIAKDSAAKGLVASTLGPIIHNPQMVAQLAGQGVKPVDKVEDVTTGTVIIRSHGVGPEIYRAITDKGLDLLDATCPHVKKAQAAARELYEDGYQVVIIGERNHPEVKSIAAWTDNTAIIVETMPEAEKLGPFTRLGVVAQTTFSTKLFEEIIEVLRQKTDEIKVNRTICTATELRQDAAREVAGKVTVMIVIGGKNSANTAHLAEICGREGAIVYHIETVDELKSEWFAGVRSAGITAGASTPDWIIEEVYQKMQEIDQELDQQTIKVEQGSIVKGKIVGVRDDEVFVDIGYKAEGVIPLSELAFPTPQKASDVVKDGDTIDVYVIDADSSEGAIKLSKLQADKILAWEKLEQAMNDKQTVEAKVVEAVKGGLSVAVLGMRGFVPASQVDIRFTEDFSVYAGQTLTLIPIEVDKTKQRVVLSRRLLLEEDRRQKEAEVFARLAPGQVIRGTVRRLTSFGAFVDVGGIDGLIHISDLSWHRVKSADEIVSVGDEVEVAVLKVDAQAKKISLSLKAVQRDPWFDKVDELAEGQTLQGKVTKLAQFGAFVEISNGLEGLVHMSELDDRRVAHAEEVVSVGQTVSVKILGIDKKNKRVALSIAQAKQDAERAEYSQYLAKNTEGLGVTIGDKLGHLFKRED
jgi:4-hydroxy-3-methylbut-2-enyl diphosphate reductase